MVAYARRMFNGGAIQTTVPLAMGSSDGSFTLATGGSTNWPDGSTGNFVIIVDVGTPEKILCSARSGLVVTVAASGRGYDGTSAASHPAGSAIQVVHCAQDDDEANQVVSAVLGQSGAAKGDILYMLSAAGPNTLKNLAVGSTSDVLQVNSGVPAWKTPANGYGVTGFAANPMVPAVSLTTAQSYISVDVGPLTGSTPTNITNTGSLAAGTWLVIARCLAVYTTASLQDLAVWIGPNSASTSGLYAATGTDVGAVAGGDEAASLVVSSIVTLGSPTTIYFVAESSSTPTIKASEATFSLANVTGISAVRIA